MLGLLYFAKLQETRTNEEEQNAKMTAVSSFLAKTLAGPYEAYLCRTKYT